MSRLGVDLITSSSVDFLVPDGFIALSFFLVILLSTSLISSSEVVTVSTDSSSLLC